MPSRHARPSPTAALLHEGVYNDTVALHPSESNRTRAQLPFRPPPFYDPPGTTPACRVWRYIPSHKVGDRKF